MSVSLKKAIGYAMSWHRFEELILLDCEAHQTRSALDDLFATLTDDDLTVDMETYNHLFYRSKEPSIGEVRLLSKTFTNGGRNPAVLGKAEDLYVVAQTGEEDESHIIFFPNLNYRNEWYRSRNSLDWAFERWREGIDRSAEPEPQTFFKYVSYGHDRWAYHMMQEDGTPEVSRYYKELQEMPQIVPAVPSEIRWYLTKHNILDNSGVNHLRPIVAQWWR